MSGANVSAKGCASAAGYAEKDGAHEVAAAAHRILAEIAKHAEPKDISFCRSEVIAKAIGREHEAAILKFRDLFAANVKEAIDEAIGRC